MISQELDILTQASDWLNKSHQVLLVTVANTWGSSPRPPGSLMAIRDDGAVVGSVSGGCIEDDLIHRIKTEDFPKFPQLANYGRDAEEARQFKLPCGGSMRLVLEPLHESRAIQDLLDKLALGGIVTRNLNLKTGEATVTNTSKRDVFSCTETTFKQIFGPRFRLLIIGTGQISSLLAEIAISLEIAVTVCEPRIEYHEQWTVDEAELVSTMPDDIVISMQVDKRTAIVALTHDPKLDDLALIEALRSPAFYVAALGSHKSNQNRRERLRDFDLSKEQVSKLHGPAGLSIGSKVPAEIAVSIAAELIAAKNGKITSIHDN